jgi:hypothetical protein
VKKSEIRRGAIERGFGNWYYGLSRSLEIPTGLEQSTDLPNRLGWTLAGGRGRAGDFVSNRNEAIQATSKCRRAQERVKRSDIAGSGGGSVRPSRTTPPPGDAGVQCTRGTTRGPGPLGPRVRIQGAIMARRRHGRNTRRAISPGGSIVGCNCPKRTKSVVWIGAEAASASTSETETPETFVRRWSKRPSHHVSTAPSQLTGRCARPPVRLFAWFP